MPAIKIQRTIELRSIESSSASFSEARARGECSSELAGEGEEGRDRRGETGGTYTGERSKASRREKRRGLRGTLPRNASRMARTGTRCRGAAKGPRGKAG